MFLCFRNTYNQVDVNMHIAQVMRDNLGADVPRPVWTRHYVLVVAILYNNLNHNNMQEGNYHSKHSITLCTERRLRRPGRDDIVVVVKFAAELASETTAISNGRSEVHQTS